MTGRLRPCRTFPSRFSAPRGLWYVQLDGKQDNLGPDREEAFRRYHDLMAGVAAAGPVAGKRRHLGDRRVSRLVSEAPRFADVRLVPRVPPVVRQLDAASPEVGKVKTVPRHQWVDAHPGWGRWIGARSPPFSGHSGR